MLQIVQHVKSGELKLEDVPPPIVRPGTILVRTVASLISAGTEKMVIDLAQKSMAGMARQRPDLVKQVVNKARKEGIKGTYQAVMSKMNKPIALGYSAAGIVVDVGEGVGNFSVGDRVAVAGAGYACHSEISCVPKNLAVKLPDNVSLENASYATVGAIALQGVRLAKVQLGEFVLVSGLGLIGLITVQLLKATGCRVVGIDPSPLRVKQAKDLEIDLALQIGSDDLEKTILDFTGGYGVDKCIITAATKSSQPVEFAGAVTRRKGKVIVVGAVGMDIPRDVYYHKELELTVSMSYGPGRYDPQYEEGGIDYPYEYVRWTEQRNLEAILQLISSGDLDIEMLTTHKFDIDKAMDAYAMIKDSTEAFTGIVLQYSTEKEIGKKIQLTADTTVKPLDKLNLGFIGAGNYASQMLLPNFKKSDHVRFMGLATKTGVTARSKGDQFGFEYITADDQALFDDDSINTIVISTRHESHADLSIKSLRSGKNTFVEKPLSATFEGLEEIEKAYRAANESGRVGLMVGLNRRFAPLVTRMMEELSTGQPKQMIYRVNSGHIPASSWHHEKAEGGGMLVGEMIHFLDLQMALCGSKPISVFANLIPNKNVEIADEDNLLINFSFEDGSTGMLAYNTIGDKAETKERLEVYSGGKALVLDDFMRLSISKGGRKTKLKGKGQDKGQAEMVKQTVKAFKVNGNAPIPFDELYQGMKAIFAVRKSLASGQVVNLDS